MNPSYYEAIATALLPLANAYQKDTGSQGSNEETTVVELLDIIALSLDQCSGDLLNVMLGTILKFFRGCAVDSRDSAHATQTRQEKHVQYISKSQIPTVLARICAGVADASDSSCEIGSFAHTAFFVLSELTRSDQCAAAVVEGGQRKCHATSCYPHPYKHRLPPPPPLQLLQHTHTHTHLFPVNPAQLA